MSWQKLQHCSLVARVHQRYTCEFIVYDEALNRLYVEVHMHQSWRVLYSRYAVFTRTRTCKHWTMPDVPEVGRILAGKLSEWMGIQYL